jgi:diphosphomevalonate decarboxylase
MRNEIYRSAWSCPSNIALVKYWGKHGRQLPNNPSISFSLDVCRTETSVELFHREPESKFVELLFEAKPNQVFQQRIENYLNSIHDIMPWISQFGFRISTRNSFPHSTGIASSASAFGALGLCLAELNAMIYHQTADFQLEFASRLARLGSGSGARSVYNGFSVWGSSTLIEGFSEEFASKLPNVHPLFNDLRDSVIIVHSGVKDVSSSAGHALMDMHPFAMSRYVQAQQHVATLIAALKAGNWGVFSSIVEKEALTLHALMMSSEPPFLLLKPASLAIIDQIQKFRKLSNLPITYTIDAGPNIHIIYPDEHNEAVKGFIESDLRKYVDFAGIIHDKAGKGPFKLT